MKQMKILLVACVMAMVLMACVNDAEYVVLDDAVVYSHWTFSFGRRYDTIPGADPATFEQVKSWLGHDSEHVYYERDLVPGVDVASLEVVRKPLIRDKKDYYYKTKPLHVADVESFKIIKWSYGSFWAKDSRYAYFEDQRFEADLPTFKVKSMEYANDKNHVYYFGDLIPGADPATFKPIGKSCYYRDKSHIWCGRDLLEDADYDSFEVDDFDSAHDKHGRFMAEKRDTIQPGYEITE